MRPTLLAFALITLGVSLFALANVRGEWRVNFVVPTGTRSVNMVINQQRSSLSGTVINEDGEFPLTGTVAGDKIAGDSIIGTAPLGEIGEGPLNARRTAE